MKYKKTVDVANKVFRQEAICLICKYFEKLKVQKDGSVEITIHSDDYGVISGNNQEVIEIAFTRNKPISKIEFDYQSDDYKSQLYLSIEDKFSSSYYGGAHYTVLSNDEAWFNTIRIGMQDLTDIVEGTPLFSRFLNSFGWILSILISAFFVFSVFRIALKLIKYADIKCPQWVDVLIVFAFFILIGVASDYVKGFFRRNYPIVDLDIFKQRSEVRTRVAKLFWWVVGTVGAMLISTYLPLRSDKQEHVLKCDGMRHETLISVTNSVSSALNPESTTGSVVEIKQEAK